jgi:predicted AAA+ superfamily ATPase
MDKSVIKDLIAENQDFVEKVTVLPRNVSLEAQGNYVFVGLRRAGKTYLMYRQIHDLLSEGIPVKQILYINFEDERLSEVTAAQLSVILNCYREMYDYHPIVFLDEIQLIEGWEKFVRRLVNTDYRVYVTGIGKSTVSRLHLSSIRN